MKKITILLSLIILVLAYSCNKEEDEKIYPCNPEWVKLEEGVVYQAHYNGEIILVLAETLDGGRIYSGKSICDLSIVESDTTGWSTYKYSVPKDYYWKCETDNKKGVVYYRDVCN